MDYWDLEELAWRVCGYSDEETTKKIDDEADINEELIDKFNIDMSVFEPLIDNLIKFTIPNKSPLTGEKYQGFIDLENSSFIVKQPYTNE